MLTFPQAPRSSMEVSIKARLLGVCAQVMLDGSMPPIALPVVRGLYLTASRDLPPLDNDIKVRCADARCTAAGHCTAEEIHTRDVHVERA